MSVVNYFVYCKTVRRCFLPWNIGMVNPLNVTFRGFYNTTVAARVEQPNRELESVLVGASKEKLDLFEHDMCVANMTSLFGPFEKFFVEEVA